MTENDVLLLTGPEVAGLLDGRESDLIDVVRRAYEAHARGHSSLPPSSFVHFPDGPRNRIISLPAYLGEGFAVAGVKWIASFPGNRERGLDRASAVVILNSVDTGRPVAVLEGSVISAKRTAASAALATRTLRPAGRFDGVGLIGCGPINFEILRFLQAADPPPRRVVIHDRDAARARRFADQVNGQGWGEVRFAADARTVLAESALVSIATTALDPHIADLSPCPAGTLILHVSLRDLTPDAIVRCDNVVDDVDHVCRSRTSVHLAEQQVGHRRFIRGTLADVLLGRAPAQPDSVAVTVFSPFGLGVLDVAVAQHVYQSALNGGRGKVIESFFP